jgi:hypothetical protein
MEEIQSWIEVVRLSTNLLEHEKEVNYSLEANYKREEVY